MDCCCAPVVLHGGNDLKATVLKAKRHTARTGAKVDGFRSGPG